MDCRWVGVPLGPMVSLGTALFRGEGWDRAVPNVAEGIGAAQGPELAQGSFLASPSTCCASSSKDASLSEPQSSGLKRGNDPFLSGSPEL